MEDGIFQPVIRAFDQVFFEVNTNNFRQDLNTIATSPLTGTKSPVILQIATTVGAKLEVAISDVRFYFGNFSIRFSGIVVFASFKTFKK